MPHRATASVIVVVVVVGGGGREGGVVDGESVGRRRQEGRVDRRYRVVAGFGFGRVGG